MNFAMAMSVIYKKEAEREMLAEKSGQAVAYTFPRPESRLGFIRMLRAFFN